jgi:hypothetical protein
MPEGRSILEPAIYMSLSLQEEFSLTRPAAGREQHITYLHCVCHVSKYVDSIVEQMRGVNHQS